MSSIDKIEDLKPGDEVVITQYGWVQSAASGLLAFTALDPYGEPSTYYVSQGFMQHGSIGIEKIELKETAEPAESGVYAPPGAKVGLYYRDEHARWYRLADDGPRPRVYLTDEWMTRNLGYWKVS